MHSLGKTVITSQSRHAGGVIEMVYHRSFVFSQCTLGDWRSTDNELLRVGLLRSRLDRTAWLDEILAEHAAVRELQSPGPGD